MRAAKLKLEPLYFDQKIDDRLRLVMLKDDDGDVRDAAYTALLGSLHPMTRRVSALRERKRITSCFEPPSTLASAHPVSADWYPSTRCPPTAVRQPLSVNPGVRQPDVSPTAIRQPQCPSTRCPPAAIRQTRCPSTPTGLQPPAQRLPYSATLGEIAVSFSTPTGLWPALRKHNEPAHAGPSLPKKGPQCSVHPAIWRPFS